MFLISLKISEDDNIFLVKQVKSLLAVTENYPDLKANQQFMELQAQLEGTENRIATERTRYSDAVAAYNTRIRKFPAIITAKLFGFESKPQFAAEAGSQTAPVVNF